MEDIRRFNARIFERVHHRGANSDPLAQLEGASVLP